MRYAASILLILSSPGAAEVVSADAHDFVIRETVRLSVPRGVAWTAFHHVEKWWSADHTYSGDSSNLSLSPVPGGCFCERMADSAGVEHLRVAVAMPMQRLVMTGALGPLLYEGVSGTMDVKFERAERGTTVTLSYAASGFVHANAADIAKGVDSVLGDQLSRFGKYAEATAPR